MKNVYFLVTLTVFSFCSCNHRSKPSSQSQQNVPDALQEKSVSAEIFTKRGFKDNLVEDLYRDLADTTPALKAFEKQLSALADQRSDSTEAYKNYKQGSDGYYDNADRLLKEIKDSLLRDRLRLLVNKSREEFALYVKNHEALLATINTKFATLNDLHTALKLVKTLPVIEKYQKENLPSAAALKSIDKEYEHAILRADSLLKK